jgi:hypothetical protein
MSSKFPTIIKDSILRRSNCDRDHCGYFDFAQLNRSRGCPISRRTNNQGEIVHRNMILAKLRIGKPFQGFAWRLRRPNDDLNCSIMPRMTSLRKSKPRSSASCPRSEIKVGNGIVVTRAAVPLKGGDGLGSPGNVITFPRFGAPEPFAS